jgi:NAD(P)-dependent dehydrogenase (short-subunit alcohol dehydrogenase family)
MAVKHYQTTKEGIELHFGANHIGHFLLTSLLMPQILAARDGARVINVSSFGYLAGGVRFDDWNFEASLASFEWHCTSVTDVF